jgi:hypothetical protein
MKPPAYFEQVRAKAARRWDQLEADPELAGPWHQLFEQIQVPRYVLSELLQNADDAGATEAAVRIEGDTFIFEHNGEDFLEEHFASLCRFGYSNKRILHTIGLRGVGFKSTFSLGESVELYTPTLSIQFQKVRFTEPHWLGHRISTDGKTCVRVSGVDRSGKKEITKNFDEWLSSATSLLFFKHIRKIDIAHQSLRWRRLKKGPVANSEWMSFDVHPNEKYLLIRSGEESFPEDAQEEIRRTRRRREDEETNLPPCRVELVLGTGGRLFVVLPTEGETGLPFACNAPFTQLPDKTKIKNPGKSPTNRWLLERCGKLAANAMIEWLARDNLSLAERALAYSLLPEPASGGSSLEDACADIVAEVFAETLKDACVLLADNGETFKAGESLVFPKELFDVWPAEKLSSLLDASARPALSREIHPDHQRRLIQWRLVDEFERSDLLALLRQKRLPKPETWYHLMHLWAYIAPDLQTRWGYSSESDELCIVPVRGKRTLYPANEVSRLGEKKLLQSEEDWEFLSQYLLVLDQKWPRYLTEQRRLAQEAADGTLAETVEAAYTALDAVALTDSSDIDSLIEQVAAKFFSNKDARLPECVRLAQIAAALGADLGDAFQFVTKDGHLASPDATILFDSDGGLEEFLPEASRGPRLLHPDYARSFTSCTREDWFDWIRSGKAGLWTFMPLVEKETYAGFRRKLDDELRRRGYNDPVEPTYKDPYFYIKDWDFESSLWEDWCASESENMKIWEDIVRRLLAEDSSYWSKKASAKLFEESRNRSVRVLVQRGLPPAWIMRLRDKPCLPDTRHKLSKPSDLLRRTPETESLLDVEPFINVRLDTEVNRPLLDLLGVQSVPTGPQRLLNILRAFAVSDNTPVHEVEKWYRRLDLFLDTCSTADAQAIRSAFQTEKLILASERSWHEASGVFASSEDDDVPGAVVLLPSVKDLALWHKVGVPDRPTAGLSIEWLSELPSGETLSQDDARRVRALLGRYPLRIWEACEHWLNLAGEWAPVATLRFALNMQTLTPWQNLHPWVKQQTGDFRALSADLAQSSPFSLMPSLVANVEERFHKPPRGNGLPEVKPWLATFGTELARIELENEKETERIRTLAERLAKTKWHVASGMEFIPYIDGKPAGTARGPDLAWVEDALYADDRLPKAKLAKRLPEEIGKQFGRPDIKAALDYAFERSPADVVEYLEENFILAPRDPSPIWEPDHPVDPPPQPIKPGLMERFALAQGFRKVGTDRYVHADGRFIVKTGVAPFRWELYDAAGSPTRYFWAKEHCLEREPLEIDAAVWGMLESNPRNYALLLASVEGAPVETTGEQLLLLRDEGAITLYPAAYRLVFQGLKRTLNSRG